MSTAGRMYHIGFGAEDVPEGTSTVLLSGDPGRSELIATEHLADGRPLARNRGLDSFIARLAGGAPVVCATSGMGAPSMSIVVNELVQVGHAHDHPGRDGRVDPGRRAHRVGRDRVGRVDQPGRGRRHRPARFPAVADPFLTVTLADAARSLGVDHHVGVMASTDTFFEGQERSASSANPRLLRRQRGIIDEYRDLGILNFEMEAGTLFKMGVVYGFAAGCVCAIIAERTEAEEPRLDEKDAAIDRAIRVAITAADTWAGRGGRLTGSDEESRPLLALTWFKTGQRGPCGRSRRRSRSRW